LLEDAQKILVRLAKLGGYNLGRNVKDITRYPPRTPAPQTPPTRTIAADASPLAATGSAVAGSPAEPMPDKSPQDGLIFRFWNWDLILVLEFGIVIFFGFFGVRNVGEVEPESTR
jgi:hypothetical protein